MPARTVLVLREGAVLFLFFSLILDRILRAFVQDGFPDARSRHYERAASALQGRHTREQQGVCPGSRRQGPSPSLSGRVHHPVQEGSQEEEIGDNGGCAPSLRLLRELY